MVLGALNTIILITLLAPIAFTVERPLTDAQQNYLRAFEAWLGARNQPFARALKDYALGEMLGEAGFNHGEVAEIKGRDTRPKTNRDTRPDREAA